jgi:hypothetical protein
MYELLRNVWVMGRVATERITAAIVAAVNQGRITAEQANEILSLPRG